MTLTPRTLRITLAVLAMGLAGIVALPSEVVVLEFVYSPDAKEILEPHIAAFNAEFGDDIKVVGTDAPSGTALTQILGGELEPDLWMPAASAWGDLLDLRSGQDLAPDDSPTLFWSPEMIVLWQSVRDAIVDSELGQVGWKEIVSLSTGEITFEELGYEGLDPFRLGHTKPTKSTSGLYAVTSEFQLASGGERLEPAMILDPVNRTKVEAIEHSIVHYGDIGSDFCDLMHQNLNQYVSASYMQETTWRGCIEDYPALDGVLTAVAPAEGTFIADYPMIALHATWTTTTSDDAGTFVSWLSEHLTPADARSQHFRPGDPDDRVLEESPLVIAERPSAQTLDAIQDAWLEVRKRANVLFVLDRSIEMATGQRSLNAARVICAVVEALAVEVSGTDHPVRDRIGLIGFADEVTPDVALAPVGTKSAAAVCESARDLSVNARDAVLYDAVDVAMRDPALSTQTTIDAVIVVASGGEQGSSMSIDTLLDRVARAARPQSPLQVITVSFGDPDEALADISDASLTLSFAAEGPDALEPEDIARELAALV